jgi:hypothetical protein
VPAQRKTSGEQQLSDGTMLTFHDTPTSSEPHTGKFDLDQVYDAHYSARISQGPNAQFRYITSVTNSIPNPGSSATPTGYYYVIAGDILNSGSDFYKAQCGRAGIIGIDQLLTDTIQHEAGTDGQSHYNNYRHAQDDDTKNIGSTAERLVFGPTMSEQDVLNQLHQALNGVLGTILTATQQEPCGGLVAGPNCEPHGGVNFSPYQACPAP